MPPEDSLVNAAVQVALPGTCGELVQGTLDGLPCLVSCPIDCYSIAVVRLRATAHWTVPLDTPKVRAALQAGLAYLGCTHRGGQVQFASALPRSRGYGSSTADIGAALYALGLATGRRLTPTEVAGLAVQVEPSDSSLFPGLALWDHLQGQRYEDLGPPPALTVVVLDPGGAVDTLAFNRLDHRAALRRLVPVHQEAFALLHEGLRQGQLEAIGAAATLSATAHQAILPHPLLDLALTLAREVKAVGVCRAHSGTVLGLLLDPGRTEASHVVACAARRLPTGVAVFSLPLVGGGPRLLNGQTVPVPSLSLTWGQG